MCARANLIVYVYLYLHAQNLKLSWITNCQLCKSVSTISCFYLTAHCILGVVVCLKGLSVSLPVAYTSGTGVPDWTEPHLSLWQTSSFPGSVLLDLWTADTPPSAHARAHAHTHTSSSLLFAPACSKNCQMSFICILISLAKRSRTSALHWIHNVKRYQLFCLKSPTILYGVFYFLILSRRFSR